MKTTYRVNTDTVDKFYTQVLDELIDRVFCFINSTHRDRIAVCQNKVAKLIVTLPFIAKCSNPGRVASAHLLIYLFSIHEAGKRLFLFDNTDMDSIFSRLDRINTFIDGDKKTIEKGMNLLALVLLCNYERDLERDIESGKPNPLKTANWNLPKLKSALIKRVEEIECPDIDRILTVSEGIKTWWSTGG